VGKSGPKIGRRRERCSSSRFRWDLTMDKEMKLLVIEDEPAILTFLRTSLEKSD
jgi:hypothetical protein